MKLSVLSIENIRGSVQDGVHRVCADVEGIPVWYESADVELQASPEIFTSAFLLPAMMQNATLCIEGAVSNAWRSNAQALMKLFHEWWGYSVVEIQADRAEPQETTAGRGALFFTAGVDSFYSLLHGGLAVDDLIYVQGFDVSLEDEQRLTEVCRQIQTLADVAGKRLVVLKTNLRQHPLIQKAGWGHVHGGALASVAHSLPETSEVIISSSFSRRVDLPWGSHWQSDPLWSSDRVELVHFGDQIPRTDKLIRIADDPLVQRHLRVCWKNKNENMNCCQCEKCVRTMTLLEACGELGSYEVFPSRDRLPQMIKKVRYVVAGVLSVYEDFLKRNLSPNTEAAVKSLLRRSRFRLFRKAVVGVINPWSHSDET